MFNLRQFILSICDDRIDSVAAICVCDRWLRMDWTGINNEIALSTH